MTQQTVALPDDPALAQVLSALSAEGAQALVVGGAVRNALLGEPISDIDIATSARPAETVRLAKAAGLRTELWCRGRGIAGTGRPVLRRCGISARKPVTLLRRAVARWWWRGWWRRIASRGRRDVGIRWRIVTRGHVCS